MNKAEIRPLLEEALVKAQVAEKFKHEAVQKESGFALDLALEAWKTARLKRAQAELQLWLADRQWEREEQVAEAGEISEQEAQEALKTVLRTTQA